MAFGLVGHSVAGFNNIFIYHVAKSKSVETLMERGRIEVSYHDY